MIGQTCQKIFILPRFAEIHAVFFKKGSWSQSELSEIDVQIPKPSEQLSKQIYICSHFRKTELVLLNKEILLKMEWIPDCNEQDGRGL